MRAKHILLEYHAKWPQSRQRVKRTKEEAFALATRLIDEIMQGAWFDDLARTHSDCPSRVEGGDLGRFHPDDMSRAFSDAVAALEIDQLSNPVHTEHGVHVVWRTE